MPRRPSVSWASHKYEWRGGGDQGCPWFAQFVLISSLVGRWDQLRPLPLPPQLSPIIGTLNPFRYLPPSLLQQDFPYMIIPSWNHQKTRKVQLSTCS
jgi:hypothetical protein